MRIGRQSGRVINNVENRFGDDRLRRDVQGLVAVIRRAAAEGELDERRAAVLEEAAGEVGQAVAADGPHSSRFRRAIENLKHVSKGAAATAGIAEAVDSILRTVASP